MVSVENVTVVPVPSFEELSAIISRGSEQRHTVGTQMNEESSRSHLILSIIIESTNLQTQSLDRGKAYMVELYQDTLADLLLPKNVRRLKLDIKKDSKGMVSVENVIVVPVPSFEELSAIISRGSEQRHTAGTQMNEESSRSHLILSIIIEGTNLQTQSLARGKEKELVERHNVWLNEELTAKVNSVLEIHRSHSELEAEMSVKLAEVEKQLNECSGSLKWNSDRVKELEGKLTSAQEELCSAKDTAAAYEEHISAKLSTMSSSVSVCVRACGAKFLQRLCRSSYSCKEFAATSH